MLETLFLKNNLAETIVNEYNLRRFMKRFGFVLEFGLLCCCMPLLAQQTESTARQADSLLTAFEQQTGEVQQTSAIAFLRLMADEGLLEEMPDEAVTSDADSLKLWVYYWAGEYALDNQQYRQGICYANKALPLCPEAYQPMLRSDCLSLLAIHHFRLSEYEQALKHARQALEIDRKLGDKSRISSSLNTLAGICLASRQPKEGEPYILEAIHYSSMAGDSARIAIQEGMASEIYHALGREEEALQHAERAYAINTALGMEGKAAIRLAQMASAQMALGRTAEAEASIRRAIPMLQTAGNRQSLAICYNQLGSLLLTKGEDEAAATCFRQALEIFIAHGDLYNQCQSHHGLSKALKSTSPTEASEHLSRYAELKDTLYQRGMASELNRYNAAYKNEQLETMHARERLHKQWILGCALLLLLLLIGVVVALQLVRRHRRRLQQHVEQLLEQLNSPTSAYTPPASQTAPSSSSQPSVKEGEERAEHESLFLQQVTQQIMEQIGKQEVNLQELSAHFCITRPQLNRKLKLLTGMNTTAYITSLRIVRAKELLKNSPDMSIADVAIQCGIADVSYFIALFKKATGQTPKQWRLSGQGDMLLTP